MTDTISSFQAAERLRAMALNEDLKAHVMSTPPLAHIARTVAARYIGGETIDEAFARVPSIQKRGHALSFEIVGESVRDATVADSETNRFLALADRIADNRLPSTLSLDLSHVGLVVDPELGYRNASRIAEATEASGIEMMISAEGSDRTDLVLDTYERLSRDFPTVGITVQARLHRTSADFERVMGLPGRVRLVKGAFLEPEDVAFPSDSNELEDAYLTLAEKLIVSGHPGSIATHDKTIVSVLRSTHGEKIRTHPIEFEMLLGLGTSTLDELHQAGYPTREYVVFGTEWWLYALNRIAEKPERVYTAIADVVPTETDQKSVARPMAARNPSS